VTVIAPADLIVFGLKPHRHLWCGHALTNQVDLTGKFFATANAPRSSVSRAIF
jgi:hypothetical protein